MDHVSPNEILLYRFLTGFFLAGIYPVGMKIASDYYQAGLGRSLGFLVGALVLGTAFPHLLKSVTMGFHWKYVLYATSSLSIIGGLCILFFVPNGPYRKQGQKLRLTEFLMGFRLPDFRSASFGYFGHMWELYTFWAFVPVMITTYKIHHDAININIPLLSFFVIALGGVACVLGGILSQYLGVKRVASVALFLSCLCCIASPLFLFSDSAIVFISFLFFWAMVVIADSPLFSTLVAQSAPVQARGTSLTIINCIGFSITILSIQFISILSEKISPQYIYMLLAIGPALGLIALVRSWEKK